jgi:hypothetical protein
MKRRDLHDDKELKKLCARHKDPDIFLHLVKIEGQKLKQRSGLPVHHQEVKIYPPPNFVQDPILMPSGWSLMGGF